MNKITILGKEFEVGDMVAVEYTEDDWDVTHERQVVGYIDLLKKKTKELDIFVIEMHKKQIGELEEPYVDIYRRDITNVKKLVYEQE